MTSFKMIFRYLAVLISLQTSLSSYAQYFSGVVIPDELNPTLDSLHEMAQVIDSVDLKEILYTLASDSMEGRELGTKGIEMAAGFISSKLAQYGVQKIGDQNSYYQQIGLKWLSWHDLSIRINGLLYRHLWDYLVIPTQSGSLQLAANEVVYLGYGIDDPEYSDYKNAAVKNKVILIYNGEPTDEHGISKITHDNSASVWSSSFYLKQKAAASHGVKMIIVIDEGLKKRIDENRNSVLSPAIVFEKKDQESELSTPVMYISSTMAVQLLGKKLNKVIALRDRSKKSGKPGTLTVKTNLNVLMDREEKTVRGQNIMAYIEGTDLKNEIVILSAHYDHIGKRGSEVFNGADDNASGSSTLLQISEAFQKAVQNGHRPRRSILCLWMAGEEKGLLGSLYYVNNPRLDLNKTVVDINMDMVGRIDDKYTDGNYIYVIGSDRLSSQLHELNLNINRKYSKLTLDFTYNDANDPNRFYFRSDHYNFAEKGIPSIFFFNGTHEDYHRITDDREKILFGKMEKIGRHIFYLAWAIANQDERLPVDRN